MNTEMYCFHFHFTVLFAKMTSEFLINIASWNIRALQVHAQWTFKIAVNFKYFESSIQNRYTRGISLRSPSNDRGCFSSTVGIWYLIPAELVRALDSSIPSRLSLLYFPKHLFQIINSPVESIVSDCISPAELTLSDCISPTELTVTDCIFPGEAAAPQSSMPDRWSRR